MSQLSATKVRLVFSRDKYTCAQCAAVFDPETAGGPHGTRPAQIDDASENFLTVDHIVPRNFGGSHQLSNLRAVCYACNTTRGSTIDEATIDLMANWQKERAVRAIIKSLHQRVGQAGYKLAKPVEYANDLEVLGQIGPLIVARDWDGALRRAISETPLRHYTVSRRTSRALAALKDAP